jgi:hypothetical protein
MRVTTASAERLAEMRRHLRRVRIVPVESFGEVRPRGGREEDPRHLPSSAVKLGVDFFP